MNQIKVGKSSTHGIEYWKNLLLFAVICSFLANILWSLGSRTVGGDFLGYWSVGKIADQKGFSETYTLENLRITQLEALERLGYSEITDESSYSIMPVPYLSFFLVPFKYLSRIELIYSYWTWTLLNLAILIGYLVFFLRKTNPEGTSKIFDLRLIILMLISWPVLINIIEGQVTVFLLVCAGEFIRYSVAKKPLLAGIWLGGMLLKPQLLFLVIPIFLLKRNWKLLGGFCIASGMILLTSVSLSGFTGFIGLLNLWMNESGIVSSAPRAMMNWRMIGANINAFMNTSLGWVITGLGMVLTILAVYVLIRRNPNFGSPAWVMTMLGIFSATLAITWHSHAHMAMILIPFLIYASIHKLLPEKIIFLWATTSQVTYIGLIIINLFVFSLMTIANTNCIPKVIGFLGLITNLIIFISTLKYKESQPETLVECAG